MQELIEWKSWSGLPLMQRAQLPAHPGIYVVVDAEDEVWYVGRAINLNARWNGKSHHRYKQLSRTNNKRSYRIHWQIFPAHELNDREQQYINLFKPHLNYSRVKAYARKAVQPNEEIGRLLKVLNRKTQLFPTVRSVILGYYTELDEDEGNELQEYISILVATTVNDYQGAILNSYNKSFSKKGNSLKGSWRTFESDCGIDDPERRPLIIPVFVLGNVSYEFICYSQLITRLEEHPSSLHSIEIEKQSVLALKEIDTLASLMVEHEYFDARSRDYLRYRAPDLHPILQLTTEISVT